MNPICRTILFLIPLSACQCAGEDITDKVFTNQDPECTAYVGAFSAAVKDSSSGKNYTAYVEISENGETCTFRTNSIPNHDFNEDGSFVTPVATVNESFEIPITPSVNATATALTLEYDNAIFLNGAKLDLLAAACYGVGDEPLGEEKIGCFNSQTPWRYDPMHPGNDFGADSHNAHTQPDGAYHYHGDPRAMYDMTGDAASGVIGFAADGFPIYGPYIDDDGSIREVTSSYVLKAGERSSLSGEGAFPGASYDGTFNEDYQWEEGAGDLDACNGMERHGQYAYYVTRAYPWVMRCYQGTPDASFRK